jgi:hypothetical protein
MDRSSGVMRVGGSAAGAPDLKAMTMCVDDVAANEPPALVNRIMLDVTDAQISLMELGRWANATTGYENREMGCIQEQVVVAHGRLHDLERTVGALRSELDRLLSHLRGV